MTVADSVDQDLRSAIKQADAFRRDTLRLVKSALHNAKIELGHDPTDPESIAVISREIKKRQEAAEAFRLAGRTAAAETERQEAELLGQYLPPQLADEEVKAKVIKYLTEHPDQKQIGPVMAGLAPEVRGQADIGLVASIVKEQLADRLETG